MDDETRAVRLIARIPLAEGEGTLLVTPACLLNGQILTATLMGQGVSMDSLVAGILTALEQVDGADAVAPLKSTSLEGLAAFVNAWVTTTSPDSDYVEEIEITDEEISSAFFDGAEMDPDAADVAAVKDPAGTPAGPPSGPVGELTPSEVMLVYVAGEFPRGCVTLPSTELLQAGVDAGVITEAQALAVEKEREVRSRAPKSRRVTTDRITADPTPMKVAGPDPTDTESIEEATARLQAAIDEVDAEIARLDAEDAARAAVEAEAKRRPKGFWRRLFGG